MKPLLLRQTSGFLLGAAVAIGPGLMLFPKPWAQRPPAKVRHDYFPPPHLAEDPRFRIVAFGSSTTHGYGASSPQATYPAQLQALFDRAEPTRGTIDVVNRGIDGEDVGGMLRRLDDDILPRRPDLIVWQLGSNDAIHGMAPADFARLLREGIGRIQAAGIPLILVGPQWNPDLKRAGTFARINDTMLAAGRARQLVMINRFDLMQRWLRDGTLSADEMIGADGLHMTDRGYALLARAVFESVTTQIPAIRARLDGSPAG